MNTRLRNKALPYLFMLPATLVIVFVYVVPFLSSIYFSMTDWNGISWNMKFIGLKNYLDILHEQSVGEVFMNNVKYFLLLVFVQNFVGLMIALLLNTKMKGRNFFRAVFFMPTIVSIVAVGFIWSLIFDPMNGPIPILVQNFHLNFLKDFQWLGDINNSLYVISGINIWQWAGWNMVIYLAGLQSIPKELLESADVDGARSIKRFLNVTLPMLAPAITVNIVSSSIGALKLFDLPFILTKGGPGHASETLAITIYNNSFLSNKMGYGIALSLVLFLLVLIVSILQMVYLRAAEGEIN